MLRLLLGALAIGGIATSSAQLSTDPQALPRGSPSQAVWHAQELRSSRRLRQVAAERPAAGGVASASQSAGAQANHDCSNDSSGLSIAVLKVEAAWKSHGTRAPTDTTLVTQMSPGKQENLAELCAVWSGVISIAVYVPLLNGKLVSEAKGPASASVADVVSRLAAFHKRMDTQGPCKLDMTLFSEEVATDVMAAFYPVNSLRNRALARAKTEMVLLSDVDFLVDFGLSDPVRYEAMRQATHHHGAIVLPAFEPADALGIEKGRELALRTAELDDAKPRAVQLFNEGNFVPFHLARWDLAHRATNFSLWTKSSSFYDITYEHDFEPYIVVARKGLPQYDERLRGYFENKAVHIRHMATLGYAFLVHPTAFVVHLPHEESAARRMIIAEANLALRNKIQKLGEAMRQSIDARLYSPVTTDSCTPEQLAALSARSKAEAQTV